MKPKVSSGFAKNQAARAEESRALIGRGRNSQESQNRQEKGKQGNRLQERECVILCQFNEKANSGKVV